MRVARRWGVVLALGGVLACGGDATGPRPGTLDIRLATPTADADGAILFTVAGPAAPLAASAPPGLRIFFTSLQGTTAFAVTGPLAAGVIAQIEVADVGRVGAYVATVQQVAGSDNALRTLTGYALTVTR